MEEHGYRLALPDLQVFMAREQRALALFLERWAEGDAGAAADAPLPSPAAEVAALRAAADALKTAMQRLWVWTDEAAERGYYAGYDVVAGRALPNRTYMLAWPLWEGMEGSAAQRDASVDAVTAADMWTEFGVRSTSSCDPRYSNVNVIVPYRCACVAGHPPTSRNLRTMVTATRGRRGAYYVTSLLPPAPQQLARAGVAVPDGRHHRVRARPRRAT